jgi:hypothetical protein
MTIPPWPAWADQAWQRAPWVGLRDGSPSAASCLQMRRVMTTLPATPGAPLASTAVVRIGSTVPQRHSPHAEKPAAWWTQPLAMQKWQWLAMRATGALRWSLASRLQLHRGQRPGLRPKTRRHLACSAASSSVGRPLLRLASARQPMRGSHPSHHPHQPAPASPPRASQIAPSPVPDPPVLPPARAAASAGVGLAMAVGRRTRRC